MTSLEILILILVLCIGAIFVFIWLWLKLVDREFQKEIEGADPFTIPDNWGVP